MIWNFNQINLTKEVLEKQIKLNKTQDTCLKKYIVSEKIKKSNFMFKKIEVQDNLMEKYYQESLKGDYLSEAKAAKRYWRLLFGKGFVRSDLSNSTNSLLNYGYAIIRSAFCRFIMAHGLHPSFGTYIQTKRIFSA